jgi:hypothetical protein
MSNPDHIKTRYHLDEASDSLLLAYYTADPFHIINARQSLIRALCGGDGGRSCLEELVLEAIDSVHDMGVTHADYSRSVVTAILDSAAPLPATPPATPPTTG